MSVRGVGPTGVHVAQKILAVRRERGLTLTDVSARLESLGHPILLSGLSKIENEQRRVDVDDLVALAIVLDVSPLDLLLPGVDDEPQGWLQVVGETGAGYRQITSWQSRTTIDSQPSSPVTPREGSLYLSQVRDFIAPIQGLNGRDSELEALADFCRSDQQYLWIQAPPWSGKTALLSWFVLQPPEDTTVIAHFVTNRVTDQNDHTAFTTAVLDQLAVLLPDQVSSIEKSTYRDGLRNELLTSAARLEAAAGRRLVLVVDGLNEDSGLPTIASLLPVQPDPNLRIIVSSRPNPSFIVPTGHPLANASVFALEPSPFATGIRNAVVAEIDALLRGSIEQRDLIALFAVAKKLTASDLGELTNMAPFEIDSLLIGTAGQGPLATIVGAIDISDGEPVYLLAHQALHPIVKQRLGDRILQTALEQIYAWADRYRDEAWPRHTPDFLLHQYFSVLVENRDLQRMTRLVLDEARHDRMRERTGDDSTALAEIHTAHQILCAEPEPDLPTTERIARHRDLLQTRSQIT